MKSGLISAIMVLVLLSPMVLAQVSPPPTAIVQMSPTSVNPNIANINILLEDISIASESKMVKTNENGDILKNIDELFPAWKYGHTIRATIIDCQTEAECVQTQTVRIDGNIDGVWFKFGVAEAKFCAEVICVPTVTTEYAKCDVDKTLDYGEVYGPDNCNVKITAPPKPEATGFNPTTDELLAGLGASLAALGAGYYYAVRVRKKESGEVVKDHKHPGIRGYHEIKTLHSFSKIRHPRYCSDPVYQKDSSGRWEFVKCKSGLHRF